MISGTNGRSIDDARLHLRPEEAENAEGATAELLERQQRSASVA